MIVCAQCGKEHQQNYESENCAGCGAALIPSSFWDINGDGKVDFDDVKEAVKKLSHTVAGAAGDLAGSVKKAFRNKAEKDRESIDRLVDSFKGQSTENLDNTPLLQFQNDLKNTISVKISERIAAKPEGKKYLNFMDAQILTTSVHNIFTTLLSFTPRQVSAACALSKAILAPSKKDQQNLVKAAIGFSGGTVGIGMVISAVGSALGWGAGIVASITAVFVSSSITGPIMWGVGGLSLTAIAAYFAKTSDHEVDTERFINVLQASLEKAVEAIWDEHGEKLSKSANDIRHSSEV